MSRKQSHQAELKREREMDKWYRERAGEILKSVTIAVHGAESKTLADGTVLFHSHHDLGERVAAIVAERDALHTKVIKLEKRLESYRKKLRNFM